MNIVVEEYRSRVLLAPQTTATAAGGYVLPTAGSNKINIRAIAKMGNAADLVLTVNYADDTSGTNATAFSDVPVYVNGVRQAIDSETYTIGDATGNFIVDFAIDPILIPAGKHIGIGYGNSNAANLVAAEIIENVGYKPTAS